ncbi:2'-5' RNA ligase family protein [Mycolicibacterium sp. P1-18]|uniref:2'-5' RNA ligase family protein n=1 Tax=Mycolicibacterium sp. P1-18 TaxID=2024615 RepID=UPI0011F3F3EC|nr:2'-5' RNA ligase family protein [Mycolicibacterium sp. P1-18]KAA0101285.1 2'-5' RNA ligase family protein [Mycolicibacterium sp. P1-18]
MAHSVELLLDQETDDAIRRQWDALAEAGLPSQAHHRSETNRPHVTLTVGARIDSAVDGALRELAGRLPLPCRIGAPLVFGHRSLVLARLVVPDRDLLDFHAAVDGICAPHLPSGPFPHARPGQWTPHVTLARRLAPADLAAALDAVAADAADDGTFARLRRWDGDARVDTVIA